MSEVRIPTLLGLGILFVGLIIGVLLVFQRQTLSSRASSSANPKNMTISNITDNSVTISWSTDNPAPGFVQAGPQEALGLTFKDERDLDQPKDHLLHYVTINNLTPNQTFYYKISSGSVLYPQDQTLSFTTASESKNQSYNPLQGSVEDVNNQPVQEALVTLQIDGAQKLTTITKIAGTFILPLAYIRTTDLAAPFEIEKKVATVTVESGEKLSRVKVKLPFTAPLPPIVLGKDQDFTDIPVASAAAVPVKYDFNNDGILNTADTSYVAANKGRNPKDKQVDVNNDGIVDQKDLDIVRKEIERNNR